MKQILFALAFLCVPLRSNAFTVISTSTGIPPGTEQSLIAETTTFFNATVVTNPLFPGTYNIMLYGPGTSQFDILKDSGTFPFVWGEGIEDQRALDIETVIGPSDNCMNSSLCVGVSSMTVPGDFLLSHSTYSVMVDSTTCFAMVCTIASEIFQQGFAAPPTPPHP